MILKEDVYTEVHKQLTELDEVAPERRCECCIDRAIDLAIRKLPRCDDAAAEIAGFVIDTLLDWKMAIIAERAAAFEYD